MRWVRNQVCEFMTGNNQPIPFWAQVKWYYQTYKGNPNIRGFLAKESGKTVGYGLIINYDGRWAVTAGFIESARGKGYGRKMFGFLNNYVFTELKQQYVYLDVLATNTKAVALYRSLGYKTTGELRGTLTMRCESPYEAGI